MSDYITINTTTGKCSTCKNRPWPGCGYLMCECNKDNDWAMREPDPEQLAIEAAMMALQVIVETSPDPMQQYVDIVNKVAALKVPKS